MEALGYIETGRWPCYCGEMMYYVTQSEAKLDSGFEIFEETLDKESLKKGQVEYWICPYCSERAVTVDFRQSRLSQERYK